VAVVLAAVLPAVTACNRWSSDKSLQPKVRRIAVIPKSTAHVFWNSVEAGARLAADELGIEIIWKAPIKESDRAAQIQLVQQLTADNVDGIVLAPLDSRALVGPVRAATRMGVPVVIIDSALEADEGSDYVSFVATDNELGGRLGGEQMAELLQGQGKVVLLRYMAGSASTTEREAGFLSAIAKYKGIEVISDNRFAGTTSGEAQVAALNMMDVLRQADGIFCPNESSTDGMLQALRKEGLAGKVRFVGFDAAPPLVKALDQGEIDALVVQNPFKMGYTGVRTIVQQLEGKSVKRRIDTGVAVATRENRNRPEIKTLLPPDEAE
jgi:ribose transport system substrate-binding protein